MKYFAINFLIVFSFLNSYASGGTKFCDSTTSLVNVDNKITVVKGLVARNTAGDDANRRGCCSHHGGVCGCSSSGRAVCCDNTLSPSCGCD